ncbi:MAG: squalene/phytoene synthase family protein [Caulobacteraceae bacterium]|nr:squalene/phytoene synthase family protein [Caulobacteraceae bacterium]
MSEPTDLPADDLDAMVARVDPDRWLSSRLIADPQTRADVIAIYAYDHELARAPKVASNPLLAEIRLTWWREVLDEVFEGRPVRRHPTAQALEGAVRRHGLARPPLEDMIDARYRELDEAPLSPAEAEDWARQSAGRAARVAAVILGGPADADRVEAASALWRLSQRPESLAPGTIQKLRAEARGVGVAAFPAAAHGVLARLKRGSRPPSELSRRTAVTLAALFGRI